MVTIERYAYEVNKLFAILEMPADRMVLLLFEEQKQKVQEMTSEILNAQ